MTRSLLVFALCISCSVVSCSVADRQIAAPTPTPKPQAESSKKIAADVELALAQFEDVAVLAVGNHGVPSFIQGSLGQVAEPQQIELDNTVLDPQLTRLGPVFRLPASSLRADRVTTDRLGKTHVRFQQFRNGRRVVGGHLLVHVDNSGKIYAANGTAHDGFDLPADPEIDATQAVQLVGDAVGLEQAEFTPAELTYLLLPNGETMYLTWETEMTANDGGHPLRDLVYIDAISGELRARLPQIHHDRQRRVYDAGFGTTLPGTLVMEEGSAAVADLAVVEAYNNTGITHDCYRDLFGRDALDDLGSPYNVVVHFESNYANAFWDGTHTVYGDGDGEWFSALGNSLDVVAHELTHGVTHFTAGLIYQNESGALNESMSDILASTCSAYHSGQVTAATWLLAEDVYTPAIDGDALRYMADPMADGFSPDFYADRYTGTEDNGGVHYNSGIAALAFKLLVTGGAHPRAKSSVDVPAIGMDRAAQIFYRALVYYMTPGTQFADARTATAQAAFDLYDEATVYAVHDAWNAVGVPGGVDMPTPVEPQQLVNGVPLENLMGDSNEQLFFTVHIPEDADQAAFVITGGSGDADLYIRYDARPTMRLYDYRPFAVGNEETVVVDNPAPGTWQIMVHAWQAFQGVSLSVTYASSQPVPQEICDNDTDDDGDTFADCADADCLDQAHCQQTIAAGDLVITEIMANPASGPRDPSNEWFEIYNSTDATIDLAGCTVSDGDGQPVRVHTIAGSVEVPAQGYVVLAYAIDAQGELGFTPDYLYSATRIVLANSGDQIELRCGDGLLIDRVDYGSAGFTAVESGVSLELATLDAAANDDPAQWCTSTAAAFNGAGELGTPGAAGGCDSEITPVDLQPGDLVISEILYNPAATEPSGEWFEVLNNSGSDLHFAGLRLTSGDAESVIEMDLELAAEQRLVLCRSTETGPQGCLAYSSLRLNNSGSDQISIFSQAGDLIDQVSYQTVADWPQGSNGVAIELDSSRLDATANDRASSWCLAVQTSGADFATPGQAASCAIERRVPELGDLVITEILYNPSQAEPHGEWFEVLNTSADNLDLSQVTIANNSSSHQLGELVLDASSRLVFCRSTEIGPHGCSPYSSVRLNNGGDSLSLTLGALLLDRVDYSTGQPWPASQNGVSIELSQSSENASDNDAGENWCHAISASGVETGTPGDSNDCP